jgi:hypothetical protein
MLAYYNRLKLIHWFPKNNFREVKDYGKSKVPGFGLYSPSLIINSSSVLRV